jgi:glycosyltransferase involved in cell wall biosynthesis
MKNGKRKQIKIVRVIARLNIGGPAMHTILLSSSLNKRGYRDVLVCGRPGESEGDMMYFAADNGVSPVFIPELGRRISVINDLKSFFSLLSIIRKERPHIVHTHTAKAGTLGRLAALVAGVPVKIHTFHGHVFEGYFTPAERRLFIFIERFLALFTNRIITVSKIVGDEIIDKFRIADRSKIVAIPLGLELDEFIHCEKSRGVFRKKMSLDDNVRLVGIVGRLVPVKNHKMFFDAAKKLMDRVGSVKVRFVVIGDGEMKGPLTEIARRLGIDRHVIFTGWVKNLAEIYADLDVVALTSLNEGTPVSLIEAMASARPVVSTNVGGVRDIVLDGETGLLSKPDDPDDFSDKLFTLLENPDKGIELGKRGREFVKNRYGKERLVSDIKNLYDECLRRLKA